MAFAIGEFNTVSVLHGSLPVSLWYRKGLDFDASGMLREVTRMISHFESLLIPYPYEKYAVVLLPEFGGGMEHVGITFQEEQHSMNSNSIDTLELTAHELGHQWFGDYVTVSGWDDLWIKEGMATVLGQEGVRPYEDKNHAGRLNASDFNLTEGDKIVDPDLTPDDKYTSGPYGRSAWLLTQIEVFSARKKFWGTLRQVLKDHAFESINTAEFLSFFTTQFSSEKIQQVRRALSAKKLPDGNFKYDAATQNLTVSIEDLDGAMVAPMEAKWMTKERGYWSAIWEPGITYNAKIPKDALLVIDPQDRHPLEVFDIEWKEIEDLIVPTTPENKLAFREIVASAQAESLVHSTKWQFSPQELVALEPALGSDGAQIRLIRVGCALAKKNGITPEWKNALTTVLANPPSKGLPGVGMGLTTCEGVIPESLFVKGWKLIEEKPTAVPLTQLWMLHQFKGNIEAAFKTWAPVSLIGVSTLVRMMGASHLANYIANAEGTILIPTAQQPSWKQHFRSLLGSTEIAEIQAVAVAALKLLKAREALPDFRQLILKSRSRWLRGAAICVAHAITGGDNDWKLFSTDLLQELSLSADLKEKLTRPETCPKKATPPWEESMDL